MKWATNGRALTILAFVLTILVSFGAGLYLGGLP